MSTLFITPQNAQAREDAGVQNAIIDPQEPREPFDFGAAAGAVGMSALRGFASATMPSTAIFDVRAGSSRPIASGTLRAGVAAARAADRAAIQIATPPMITQEGFTEYRYDRNDVETRFGRAAARLAEVRRETVGVRPDAPFLEQLLFGLAEPLAMGVAAGYVAGPVGAAGVMFAGTEGADYYDMRSRGIDRATARDAALINATAMAAGALLPASLAGSLTFRVGTGAAMNVGVGVAQRGAMETYLRSRGYEEEAQQYRTFDPSALLVDAVLGGVFGGMFGSSSYRGPTEPAPLVVRDELVQDATAEADRIHREVLTAPGVPLNGAARRQHSEAMATAMRQAQNDEPIDVGAAFWSEDAEPAAPSRADAVIMAEEVTAAREALQGTGSRLLTFIRRMGGVRDDGGDVAAVAGSRTRYPGLITNNGRSLDDVALAAWEAGYFSDFVDRPEPNDLIEALRRDLAGDLQRPGTDSMDAANARQVLNYYAERGVNLRLNGDALTNNIFQVWEKQFERAQYAPFPDRSEGRAYLIESAVKTPDEWEQSARDLATDGDLLNATAHAMVAQRSGADIGDLLDDLEGRLAKASGFQALTQAERMAQEIVNDQARIQAEAQAQGVDPTLRGEDLRNALRSQSRSLEDIGRAAFLATAEEMGLPEIRTEIDRLRRYQEEAFGVRDQDPEEDMPFWSRSPFYSAVERFVAQSTTQRASGSQWWATISKAPGVKREELDWMGLEEFLRLRDEPAAGQNSKPELVTRDDVLSFIRSNGVRVEETVLGEESPENLAIQRQLLPLIEEYDRLSRDIFTILGRTNNRPAEADNARIDEINARLDELEPEIANLEDARTVNPNQTKWSSYTLPGGSGYREVLLRLPVEYKGDLPSGMTRNASGQIVDSVGDIVPSDAPVLANLMEPAPTFRSSHWDQPNVLAHVRIDERTDAQGRRILAVHEVQSDWHQGGRERGYGKTRTETQFEAFYEANGQRVPVGFGETEEAALTAARGWQGAGVDIRIEQVTREVENPRAVPDAPFKNNAWAALALKRVIRLAADEGFDAVAWNAGEYPVNRFSLERAIDRIEVTPWVDGAGARHNDIRIYAPDGRRLVEDDGMSAGRLREMVGEEMAKKIEALPVDQPSTISGADLKVGGEGMRAFYDRILPNIANDIGKKHGARVERIEIDTPAGRDGAADVPAGPKTFHLLPLTDSLREAALTDGLPLFARADRDVFASDGPAVARLEQEAIRHFGKDAAEFMRKGGLTVLESPDALPFDPVTGKARRVMDVAASTPARQRPRLQRPMASRAPDAEIAAARAEGYTGSDPNEALEWQRAKAKGLDMRPEARMARAKAMGFDTSRVLYHGTRADFSAFVPSRRGMLGPGVYLTDSPSYAARYAQGDGARVMPVLAKTDLAQPADIDAAWTKVRSSPEADKMSGPVFQETIDNELRQRGFGGKDRATQIVVWDPSNIRSIHAAFDPDFADSPNLMASRATDGLRGLSYRGKAYLFANAVMPDQVKGLMLHEVGAHLGLKRMLGAGRFEDLLNQMEGLVTAQNPAALEARARAEEGALRPSHVPEETIAYLVENNPDMPFVRRLIATVRQWLWRTFGDQPWIGQLTSDDIVMMVTAAARKYMREYQAQEAGGPVPVGPGRRMDAEVMAARAEGYEGSDPNEAMEWRRARAKGLDMSLEARMGRARPDWIVEEPLYRGLTSAPTDPRSISPRNGDVTYLSTNRFMAEGYADGGPVFEVVVRRGKYFDGSNPEHMADLLSEVKRSRPALADRLEAELEGWTPNGDNVNQVEPYVLEVQRLGYIGMRIREDGMNNVGIFYPKDIRSIHAAFDPDFSDSANLMASRAPGSRDIPVLPEPDSPEWAAMTRAAEAKRASGERLTQTERWMLDLPRQEQAELQRILQRVQEGRELTPASERFLRDRGIEPPARREAASDEEPMASRRRAPQRPESIGRQVAQDDPSLTLRMANGEDTPFIRALDEADNAIRVSKELGKGAEAAAACAARHGGQLAARRGLGSMAQIRPITAGQQNLIALGAGGIAALAGMAIPAATYLANTDAERLRRQGMERTARERANPRGQAPQYIQDIPEGDAPPVLMERLDQVNMANQGLREAIATLDDVPEGMVQSDIPRVSRPMANERRQVRDGFVNDFTVPGDPASGQR